LRAEPVWVETFTGLRMDRFAKLVKAVRERGGNGPGGGRPWCLPLPDRVLLVAVYYRTNLTMRQLAPLFGPARLGCGRPHPRWMAYLSDRLIDSATS